MTGADAPWSLSRCPLCGAAGRRPHAEFVELSFVRCASCGVVYKARETAALRTADFYEAGYYTHKRSRRLKRFAHRRAKAQGLLHLALEFVPARRVLDVGCAVGEVIAAAQALGLEGMGCDVSQFAVDYCNERGLPAKLGDLHQLPAADGSVDLVVLKHVFEHTPVPHRALQEIKRVLSPKGGVLVAVPDLDYWKARWWSQSRYFQPKRLGRQHYIYYRATHLKQVFESAGFSVRSISKAVFCRRRPRSFERLRFVAVAVWQALARALHLRREVIMVATLD